MNLKALFLVVACAICMSPAAQAEEPRTTEEVALGWQFSDCFVYYLLSAEFAKRDGDLKGADALARAQETTFSAAVALVGEESYRAEAGARRKDFIGRLKSPPIDQTLQRVESECRVLINTKLEVAAPRILALAKKKQEEKAH